MLLFIQFYPLSLVSTRLHDKTFSVFYHVNVGILAGDNLFPLPVDNTVPVRVFGDSFDRFGILAATQVEAFNADISVTRNNQLGFFYGSTSGKTILSASFDIKFQPIVIYIHFIIDWLEHNISVRVYHAIFPIKGNFEQVVPILLYFVINLGCDLLACPVIHQITKTVFIKRIPVSRQCSRIVVYGRNDLFSVRVNVANLVVENDMGKVSVCKRTYFLVFLELYEMR